MQHPTSVLTTTPVESVYLTTGVAKQVQQTRRLPVNVLAEIALLILSLQARSPRIACTDPCQHECTVQTRKRAAGTSERADFERSGHTFSAVVAWNTIRLNTKLNSYWLAWVSLSRGSWGNWNCRWTLIFMHPDVKWSETCYQARTKGRISSDVLGPKNRLRSHLTASNS